MREWYSGSTSPCQGEDRGFDPRLALITKREHRVVFFFCYKRVDGARFHVTHVKTDPPPSTIEPFALGASHHSLGVARDAGSRVLRNGNAQHAWSRAARIDGSPSECN